jgi:hypothetical protein
MTEDTLWRLLRLQDASAIGVLLVVVVVGSFALHKGWLVTGGRFGDYREACEREKAACAAALTPAQTELKAAERTITEMRIMLTRLTVLEEYGWPERQSHRDRRAEKESAP